MTGRNLLGLLAYGIKPGVMLGKVVKQITYIDPSCRSKGIGEQFPHL
jgi:hypothetical protein